jgi:hypothetical protein
VDHAGAYLANAAAKFPAGPRAAQLVLADPQLGRLGALLIGGPSQPGTIGLALPFQTIESVLVLNRRTLVVANDNNYPFSSGRRPGEPDDNELIQVRLPRGP